MMKLHFYSLLTDGNRLPVLFFVLLLDRQPTRAARFLSDRDLAFCLFERSSSERLDVPLASCIILIYYFCFK